MTELSRPDHFEPRAWLGKRVAAIAALAVGAMSFIVCLICQQSLGAIPDLRISLPGLVLAVAASAWSLARRERAYSLWLLGLGLAAAALVLGWFMLLVIVLGAAVAVIVILHAVM